MMSEGDSGTPTQQMIRRVVVEEWRACWPVWVKLNVNETYGQTADRVARAAMRRLDISWMRARRAAHELHHEGIGVSARLRRTCDL